MKTSCCRPYIVNIRVKNEYSTRYVFVGTVPANVQAAINARGVGRHKSVLVSWFGPKYGRLLGFDPIGYCGGNEETFDVDEIRQQLESDAVLTTESTHTEDITVGTHYVFDVAIYPEDKIFEVREKIFVATKIPPYRQHIFWYEHNKPTQPYRLTVDGTSIHVDLVDALQHPSAGSILGLPIDKDLYVARGDVRVENIEQFSLLVSPTIYLIDLEEYIGPQRAMATSMLSDGYKFELFYYGFVIKYWPIMIPDVFRAYIGDANGVDSTYPDLARPRNQLIKQYTAEQEIIDHNYAVKSKTEALITNNKYVTLSITSAIAYVDSPVTISMRRLFDALVVSARYPMVRCYIDVDGSSVLAPTHTYMLEKRAPRSGNVPLPTMFKTGCIIAVCMSSVVTTGNITNTQSNYVYVQVVGGGRYNIKTIWSPETNLTFSGLAKVLVRWVQPLIEFINAIPAVFMTGEKLNMPTKTTIGYKSLNVSVFWKKQMSEPAFKIIKSYWSDYATAGIITSKGVQQPDYYDFTFHKGIVDYDTSVIDRVLAAAAQESMFNHYAKFAIVAMKIRWAQLYGGRNVRMQHRTADIRFDISGIREKEFELFMIYLGRFIIVAGADKSLKENPRATTFTKKLRKLKETDPELYNLKKHGSTADYSIVCQKPRQPTILTDDEISRLNNADKSALYKFHNFTLGKTAYYACDNPQYKYLSFVAGVHPKGYCLPCCGKTPATPHSKKQEIISACMTTHTYKPVSQGITRHITAYGRIEPGRLSKPPASLKEIFEHTTAPNTSYFIYGVEQKVGCFSNGLLAAVAFLTGEEPTAMARRLADEFMARPSLYTTLLNGAIATTYASPKDFYIHWRSLFVVCKDTVVGALLTTEQYGEFVAEMCCAVDLYCLEFVDADGSGAAVDLYIAEATRSKINMLTVADKQYYGLIMRVRGEYHPIIVIDPDEYFKTTQITTKLFDRRHKLSGFILDLIGQSATTKHFNLTVLQNYDVVMCYVNGRNLIYGVVVRVTETTGCYVAIDPSVNVNTVSTTAIFDPSDTPHGLTYPVETTIDTLRKLKRDISGVAVYNGKIVAVVHGEMYSYVTPVDVSATPDYPVIKLEYDPIAVNRAISQHDPPINRHKELAPTGLYRNHIYNMFTRMFVKYTDGERDSSKRDAIIKTIKTTDFRKNSAQFDKFLVEQGLSDTDLAVIRDQTYEYFYRHFDKSAFITEFTNRTYEFDQTTVIQLKNKTYDEALRQLAEITAKFTVEADITPSSFPNTFTGCKISNAVCAGKKLIVPPNHNFNRLLLDDIFNPLVTFDREDIVDFFQFEERPDQVLTITKIQTLK
jgi:hypothetical protein